jgi:hypothetical protein
MSLRHHFVCGPNGFRPTILYNHRFLSSERCRLETQPDLHTEIERLQKDLFWMKCITSVLFLCLAAAFITTWFRRPKTVEANEFVVRDRTGNVVAKLGEFGFGDTCLMLTANQHVSVANLCSE